MKESNKIIEWNELNWEKIKSGIEEIKLEWNESII